MGRTSLKLLLGILFVTAFPCILFTVAVLSGVYYPVPDYIVCTELTTFDEEAKHLWFLGRYMGTLFFKVTSLDADFIHNCLRQYPSVN